METYEALLERIGQDLNEKTKNKEIGELIEQINGLIDNQNRWWATEKDFVDFLQKDLIKKIISEINSKEKLGWQNPQPDTTHLYLVELIIAWFNQQEAEVEKMITIFQN